jgi:AraC family transcriptional regulator
MDWVQGLRLSCSQQADSVFMVSRLHHILEWAPLAEQTRYNARHLAAYCTVSLRQLERFWKASFGQAPQVWLDEMRIEKAKQLLARGSTLKETAFALDFKQVSHFCRKFKHHTGNTPSEFLWERVPERGEKSPSDNECRPRIMPRD